VANRLEEVPGYKESEMTERLVVYHRHIHGILDAYKSVLQTFNADQPKTDVLSQGKIIQFEYEELLSI
jgi:hypothetical protein